MVQNISLPCEREVARRSRDGRIPSPRPYFFFQLKRFFKKESNCAKFLNKKFLPLTHLKIPPKSDMV